MYPSKANRLRNSTECQTATNQRKLRKVDFLGWEAKEKYRGVFEIQKSGDKTSSGEIGLDIRTHASPKVGQDLIYIRRNFMQIIIIIRKEQEEI